MQTQTFVKADRDRYTTVSLPRSLSVLETWGFGLTGHLSWIGTAPLMHAALGTKAILVWLPSVIVGMLLNLQVKRLGQQWPDMAGGTPNYTTRLLKDYPALGRYAAIAYYVGWVGYLPVNAIILTDLIKTNLTPFGIPCPDIALKIGFTVLAYVVALSGTKALAILHTFFIIPAVGFLLLFCFQGIGWLALSPDSPGFFSNNSPSLTFVDWAKWYFVAIYSAYSCETASSFVADSRKPGETLRFLSIAAWLIPPIFLGGSWVLSHLATAPGLGEDSYLNLVAAAQPFWGQSTSFLITLLLVSSMLLSTATCVSNSCRILYQLALDGHFSPVFTVVSKAGVLEPSILFSLLASIFCLVWGDVSHVVLVTTSGYFAAMMIFHLGLWLQRKKPAVLWPWWSLGFLFIEAITFVVGGAAWGWQDVLTGLLIPWIILAINAAIRRISFPPFRPEWWMRRYRRQSRQIKDFLTLQVRVLIVLVCGATTIGWVIRDKFDQNIVAASNNILMVLLLTTAFVAIAIACWTTLPQVAAIDEAREQAENLFMAALDTVPDTILVVDENGAIEQANPAAEQLFQINTDRSIGHHLNELFSELAGTPEQWPNRSELKLRQANQNFRIVEATISQRSRLGKLQEYIVILRDITERKQAEEALLLSEATLRKQTTQLQQTLQELKQTQAQLIQTEKMSSLGQLVAGVAHEINNPVNFIYGNLTHINKYAQNLLDLIKAYQQNCNCNHDKIQELIEEIELDFLIEDLPKSLTSMRVGASRIREIVLTLRNFSRLDEAEMKPVNIHEGLDSTLLILQNSIEEKTNCPGINIIKKYGNLPKVECYAGQLNQVFMNILNNGIDVLHERDKARTAGESKSNPSTIVIKTSVCDRNWVRITIKDNGLGMSQDVQARLFDPFFTTKPVGKGTGLGLSISYQIIVDKHKGRMRCNSQPGQGAEFIIEIPIGQNK